VGSGWLGSEIQRWLARTGSTGKRKAKKKVKFFYGFSIIFKLIIL
jgi:hypothetical protein